MSAKTLAARLLDPRLQTLVTRAVVVVAAAVIVLFPLSPSMSAQNTVIMALVLAIGASGLNVITGFTGYLSLSQGAFIGIGAYVGAILAIRIPDVPPLLWVPVAGVFAAAIAMLLGLVTYRSRGPAFVIITVAFLFLAQFVAIEWVPVTNGTAGLTLPLPDWPDAWGNWPFHLVLVTLLALSLLMTWAIRRTKFGMGLIAIREDEGKAGTIGVNAPVYKLLAFGASALFVGMAGSAYGYYLSFVDPIGMFSIITSALIVLSVILGGRGTLFGPVLGAFIIQPVNTFANDTFGGGNARLVLFGGLLVLLVILLPKGILPTVAALMEKARTKGTVGLSGARLNPLDRPLAPAEAKRPAPTGTHPARGPRSAQELRRQPRGQRLQLYGARGLDHRADRTQRVGQDHGVQPDLGHHGAREGRDPAQRRTHRTSFAVVEGAPRDWPNLSDHPAVPRDDGFGEHRRPVARLLGAPTGTWRGERIGGRARNRTARVRRDVGLP